MTRLARLVVSRSSHYVNQTGTSGRKLFSGDDKIIGRPLAGAAFQAKFERKSCRTLAPANRGPKPRQDD